MIKPLLVSLHKIFKEIHYNKGMNSETDTHVLIVDDEPQIVKVLEGYLSKAGYRVDKAYNGNEAYDLFLNQKIDFIILDLNLPGIDGIELCRMIRRESDVPIMMLTARVEETDRLIGLELGADDYVVKPFSPREVVARVRTILRRAQPTSPDEDTLLVGPFFIDTAKHLAKVNDEILNLTPTEFAILVFFAKQPQRVYSRLQIMEAAQGDAFEGYERTIDAHIKNLRQKIEPNPKQPEYIQTVFGVGYKLNC
jgi:two-component system alkaline phosphatase synthesis response regulator PhoP